ncbi:hypothetical protein EDB84DRAFT_1580196 [Lactarius hengduanensis]|nr:hypothetical protein EDB84DRAFT_1580196 [Lactarius hengduanensis]
MSCIRAVRIRHRLLVSPEYIISPDLIWDVRYLCATLLPHAETRLVPAATVLLRCLPVGPQGDLSQGPPNMNDDSLRCSEFFLVLTREVFLRGAAGTKELEGPCELLHETFRDILFKSGAFVPRSTSTVTIDLRASLVEAEDFERVVRMLRALCSVLDAFEGALNAAKLPAASDEALRERQHKFLPTLSISKITMGQYREELSQKLFQTQARLGGFPWQSEGLPRLSTSGTSMMRPYSVASRAVSTIEEGSEAKFQQGGLEDARGDAEGGSWYEAHDPMTGGLVPRDTFAASNEDAPSNPRNSQALSLSRPFRTPSTLTPLPSATFKTQEFYAVVLHDFSTHEWFVGKPIGRLGRPGLIPVSFVEVRDPATGKPIPDVGALMDNGTLPHVEDWKKRMLSYRANSIALGVLEESIADTPNMVSFHHEMDEYWFRLHALYQPFDPSGSSTLPPAKDLVLFRAYNDFFDFQTALLDTFPREGGREGKYPRVIPFMPGPSDHVDDSLSATRQTGLDDYLRHLCRLNRTTAHYILEHHLTREFFALKPGDIENDTVPQYDLMAEVGWYDPSEDPEPVSINGLPSPVDDVVEKFQKTGLKSNGAWERNPHTALIKVKVFDRIQDDIIAIRVHPRVTHEQLLDKIQQRLGVQVARLSYRENGKDGEDYVPLQQDDDMLRWIGSTDKHVLYAD